MPTMPALDVICAGRCELNRWCGDEIDAGLTKIMRERKTRIERRWLQIASVRKVMMTLWVDYCVMSWSGTTVRRVGGERRVRTLGDEQPQCNGPWIFLGV